MCECYFRSRGSPDRADQEIVAVLRNAPNVLQKGTIDSRYFWLTMMFQKVCNCSGKFYGVDCSECAFGWSGENCENKTLVVRKSFGSLSSSENETLREVCSC